MKKLKSLTFVFIAIFAFAACQTAKVNVPEVTGTVTQIERYGHAVTDITIEEFNSLGYTLGDVVTVTTGGENYDMPYFNGYYVDTGEMMLRAYPGQEYIAICINYGRFSDVANVEVGSAVTISLKEKGGELGTQTVMSLSYTNDRADYESDEIFANFREIDTTGIAGGVLYRSCSPINDENNRAATADALAAAQGIRSVMNLADTPEEIEEYIGAEDFASDYYKTLYDSGNVIALGMPVNFQSDEFAEGIVRGLVFLSEHETPYLIHCTEGKDRAGFASALLEALMGASRDEIISDYMESYANYYDIDESSESYEIIVDQNIMAMLRTIAGVDSDRALSRANLAAGAEQYLLAHGMSQGAVNTLKAKLSTDEASDEVASVTAEISGIDNNIWFTRYGNVNTNLAVSDLFAAGFEEGDLVEVSFLETRLTVPIVPTYSYVEQGSAALMAYLDDGGNPSGNIALAINMGNFATTYGLADKITNADTSWYWTLREGVTLPITIDIRMAEEGGYLAEYLLHDLSRTNNRSDYPALSDEEFANFREISTTGMGSGRLYRTSSPINPELNRNTYADEALRAAGVTVIMNLADSAEDAAAYEGFSDSYYSAQNVIYLNLGVDFQAADFKRGLAEGLRYFANNEGVYAVHCTEGKDRAGFVSALLECFMGASYDEVVSDYMTTYENYYNVEEGSEKYNAIAESNIVRSLSAAFGVDTDDLPYADLRAEAEAYVSGIGLTAGEMAALRANLSR